MSLIINQTPVDGQSAHFPLWHVVNTDFTGSPTLRVVFEVYIGGVLIYTAKVYPPPSIGVNAYFDASLIIRNYFANYFAPTNAFFSFTTNSIYVEYQVKYGEEWIPSSGIPTGNYQQFTSTHKVYNCYPNYMQAGSLVVIGAGHSVPSDRDQTQIYFAPDYSFFMPYLRGSAVATHIFTATTRTAAGTGIGFVQSSVTTANILKIAQLRISKALFIAANPAFFPDTTDHVRFEFHNGTLAQNFTLDAKVWCHPKFTPVAIHFLNRYGAYETMIFGLVSRKEVEFEKQFYAPTEWQKTSVSPINPAPDPSFFVGAASNFNSTTQVYHPAKVQTSTMHKLRYRLTSDFVTETNYNWLKQLIASPVVYLEEAGYFYPVHISDNVWSEKKDNSDKLFNLELTVEAFSNVYSQFQ